MINSVRIAWVSRRISRLSASACSVSSSRFSASATTMLPKARRQSATSCSTTANAARSSSPYGSGSCSSEGSCVRITRNRLRIASRQCSRVSSPVLSTGSMSIVPRALGFKGRLSFSAVMASAASATRRVAVRTRSNHDSICSRFTGPAASASPAASRGAAAASATR